MFFKRFIDNVRFAMTQSHFEFSAENGGPGVILHFSFRPPSGVLYVKNNFLSLCVLCGAESSCLLSLKHSLFVSFQYSKLKIIEAFAIGNRRHKPCVIQKHIRHVVLLTSNGTMEGSIAFSVLEQNQRQREVTS